MFERFTESARESVVRAQAEARALGLEHVGTEELLLGIAAGGGDAARVLAEHGASAEALRRQAGGRELDGAALASIGIDLDEIRRRAEASFGPGALERGRRGPNGHIPLTPQAKKSLELAVRETVATGGREIRAEHVLLGVLREGGATALLRGAGTDPEALRSALRPVASRRGRGG
jgi:ATP-dependent Clp protease ATP-binding subunit ClpA